MKTKDAFYVYVYIDPRNYEEFYFGKGQGSRKDAHLSSTSDSKTADRIADIRKAGAEPIIRVIAHNLPQDESFLIETTLLWKLGRQLTNKASGRYAKKKFRPQNSLHKIISGIDYQPGIYFYNVGECPVRNWDDYKKFGFISGGGNKPRWRNAMKRFEKGDVIAAYLSRDREVGGFVGIGIIKECARPIREVIIKGRPLLSYIELKGEMDRNVKSNELCEYVAVVKWKVAVDRKQAKWKAGLFHPPLVRASLDAQPNTVKYLNKEFGINMRQLVS